MCVTDGLKDRKQSIEKTLINNLWTVDESVGNKYTDGFTDRQSAQKKFTRFMPSVYPSVNIAYHRHNTFCNFIGALTIIATFVINLFQLSKIYRWSSSVGNPISNSDICNNSFLTLWNILTKLCLQ
jgi:hypothetical protein